MGDNTFAGYAVINTTANLQKSILTIRNFVNSTVLRLCTKVFSLFIIKLGGATDVYKQYGFTQKQKRHGCNLQQFQENNTHLLLTAYYEKFDLAVQIFSMHLS